VIDELLVRYIEALVYQAVAENMASEQSARMVAMKAATDNAGNLIGELQAGLQQDPSGGDHQGTVRDRQRRRGGQRLKQYGFKIGRKRTCLKARSFSASAPWSTWSSRATRCPRCTTRSSSTARR
jgi:hypothetical protein